MPSRLLPIILLLFISISVQADDLDDFIRAQMKNRHITGLSLAVIQNGTIVKAQGYGFTDKSHTTPITPTTLFQAGSISKSVAAVGALRLVEAGKLALDEDVNAKLRTWKVPENEFTKEKKVTLRRLLSHTTGLTVHGFPGYEVGSPIPTVVQILNGTKPANTEPVRVEFVPGTRWQYSGGGYTVMQLLMVDVTNKTFPAFMQETVLGPLRMLESTYEQPLPAGKAKQTATGTYPDRSEVKGRWHIYPEMAAAGLWTTPSDLARFAISIQRSFAGKSGGVLSQQLTKQMLTDQKDNDGLGVFLEGEGKAMRFGHGGRDEGFDAQMTAGIQTGQSVVIMINANDNSRMMSRLVDAVAQKYGWPGFAEKRPVKRTAVQLSSKELAALEGRYEFANNRMITFVAENNRLYSLVDGFIDEEFVPESATRFASAERDAYMTFSADTKDGVNGFTWKSGKEERSIPRIGPFFSAITLKADPNATRSAQIEAAIKAMAQGGKAVEEAPGITPGARKAFTGSAHEPSGIKSVTYVATENVAGRGIERHGSPVAQIAYYKISTDKGQRNLIVHLTSDGLVTDYDVVEK